MVIFNYIMMCFIFGTTFLAIKLGVDSGIPPFLSASIRFLSAGLVLFTWALWRKKASIGMLLRKELWITGLCLTFGTFSALYWAEQFVTSGIAAILSATGPMMILLIQAMVFHQKSSLIPIIGCFIGFIGVVILLMPNIAIKPDIHWIMGSIVILLGELGYSGGAVYAKRVQPRLPDASPIVLNAVQMMIGGCLLLLLSLVTESVHVETLFTPQAISSILYLTIAGSMLGQTVFYWLVVRTNPFFPSTWLYISPLIALMIGNWLYDEPVSGVTMIGVGTIIAGILLANSDPIMSLIKKKTAQHKSQDY